MSSVNYTNYNIDQTVRVFDKFYDYDVNVPAAEYDIVYSYFESTMKTKQAAGNFTVSLFRVAQNTNIPALTLLEQFQGTNGVGLDVQMAYYLNQIRSRATLLGVSNPVIPNFYAARNVVQ
jgi:pyruvate/2-oxoacid:ferredoxin oxidoreductase alpha subunit